jgi:hypothetical protein
MATSVPPPPRRDYHAVSASASSSSSSSSASLSAPAPGSARARAREVAQRLQTKLHAAAWVAAGLLTAVYGRVFQCMWEPGRSNPTFIALAWVATSAFVTLMLYCLVSARRRRRRRGQWRRAEAVAEAVAEARRAARGERSRAAAFARGGV